MTPSENNPELTPLPKRAVDGHKGTFGTVLVIGGCRTSTSSMIGAPALAARAALRTGCGLARIAAPDHIIDRVIQIEPCATGVPLPQDQSGVLRPSDGAASIDAAMSGVTALAIGPGFGIGFEQQQIIMRLLANDAPPIVLDADGLNNLAQVPDFAGDLNAPLILTPHPGEFRRLAEPLGITHDPVDGAARPEAAAHLAQRLGCVVVLKGAGTVVSDGDRAWSCEVREPALATGGSGDVLTGILASLAAQFFKPHMGPVTPALQGGLDLFEIAVWGVQIHGHAAQAWAQRSGAHAGMMASDLCEEIPPILATLRAALPGDEYAPA